MQVALPVYPTPQSPIRPPIIAQAPAIPGRPVAMGGRRSVGPTGAIGVPPVYPPLYTPSSYGTAPLIVLSGLPLAHPPLPSGSLPEPQRPGNPAEMAGENFGRMPGMLGPGRGAGSLPMGGGGGLGGGLNPPGDLVDGPGDIDVPVKVVSTPASLILLVVGCVVVFVLELSRRSIVRRMKEMT